MVNFRFIGDVHGCIDEYLSLCSEAEYSLQLGDVSSIRYSGLVGLDASKHKAIAGNHDICERGHPRHFSTCPSFLGDYGVWNVPVVGDIFYVRGAFSIDDVRPNEELSYRELEDAIEFYASIRPEVVATHQCMNSLAPRFGSMEMLRRFGWDRDPITKTGGAFEKMFEIHQPKLWVFGHYHHHQVYRLGDTQFVCLDMIRQPLTESCYMDVQIPEDIGLQSSVALL